MQSIFEILFLIGNPGKIPKGKRLCKGTNLLYLRTIYDKSAQTKARRHKGTVRWVQGHKEAGT